MHFAVTGTFCRNIQPAVTHSRKIDMQIRLVFCLHVGLPLTPSISPPSFPPLSPSPHTLADSSTETIEDRASLTELQLQLLQKAYHSGQHNDPGHVQELAARTKLPATTIKAWFSLNRADRNGAWNSPPPQQTKLEQAGKFSPPPTHPTQNAALLPDHLKTSYSSQASVAYCNPITSGNYASYMTHVPPHSSSPYTTFTPQDLHTLPAAAAATSWMPYSQFAYPSYLASKRSVQGASS
jgi:hypothetical protein